MTFYKESAPKHRGAEISREYMPEIYPASLKVPSCFKGAQPQKLFCGSAHERTGKQTNNTILISSCLCGRTVKSLTHIKEQFLI